jgi:iron(III) transport system ATP-binding protein/putative spermidine/putrescine transport system ATP-binding protein
MSMLELKNVGKRFGDRWLFRDLSFTVDAGQALCLFGPSGCGKTTLLRLIAGFDRPDLGAIHIQGELASGGAIFMPPRRRAMAMVFQDFALWPHMTVERHLDFVLKTRKLRRKDRAARTDALLDLCRLEDKRRAYPATLSGGEQQRLGIARALATSPRVLLMDEPFSNLDAALRSQISDEIRRLKRVENMAVLVATHTPEDAQMLEVDRMLRMEDGKCTLEALR